MTNCIEYTWNGFKLLATDDYYEVRDDYSVRAYGNAGSFNANKAIAKLTAEQFAQFDRIMTA